jgi:uncharacterized FlaG/YvyC family protein
MRKFAGLPDNEENIKRYEVSTKSFLNTFKVNNNILNEKKSMDIDNKKNQKYFDYTNYNSFEKPFEIKKTNNLDLLQYSKLIFEKSNNIQKNNLNLFEQNPSEPPVQNPFSPTTSTTSTPAEGEEKIPTTIPSTEEDKTSQMPSPFSSSPKSTQSSFKPQQQPQSLEQQKQQQISPEEQQAQQEKEQKSATNKLVKNIIKAVPKLGTYINFKENFDQKIEILLNSAKKNISEEDVSKNNLAEISLILSSIDSLPDDFKEIVVANFKKYIYQNENLIKFIEGLVNRTKPEEQTEEKNQETYSEQEEGEIYKFTKEGSEKETGESEEEKELEVTIPEGLIF